MFVFIIVDRKHLVGVLLLWRVQLHVTVLPARAPQTVRSTPSHEDDESNDDEDEQDAEDHRKHDRSDTRRLAAVWPFMFLTMRPAEAAVAFARERMLAVARTRVTHLLTRAAVGAERHITRRLAGVVRAEYRAIVTHARVRARMVKVVEPAVTVADVTARYIAGLS